MENLTSACQDADQDEVVPPVVKEFFNFSKYRMTPDQIAKSCARTSKMFHFENQRGQQKIKR